MKGGELLLDPQAIHSNAARPLCLYRRTTTGFRSQSTGVVVAAGTAFAVAVLRTLVSPWREEDSALFPTIQHEST